MSRSSMEYLLEGYRLATAEILYRLPDYPILLQSYIWQEYDLAPEFPKLRKFLFFWENNLDGPIVSVRLAQNELITDAKSTLVTEFKLDS